MKRIQKVLFMLLAVVAFGASNALAVGFTAGSNSRQQNQFHEAGAVGGILLTVNSTVPSDTIPGGSSIVISYGADLANDNNLTLGGNIICAGPSAGAACPDGLDTQGNQLILEFGVDTVFQGGDTINIVEIRIDISGVAGTNIDASLSGDSSNPGAQPITLTPSVRVGTVVRPPLDGELGDRDDLGLNDVFDPLPILTCDPGDIDIGANDRTVPIQLNERGPAMLLSEAQEAARSDTPDVPNSGTELIYRFKDVPEGIIIRPIGHTDDKGAGSTVVLDAGDFGEDNEKASEDPDGEDLVFTFEIDDTDTNAIESIVVTFRIGSKDGDPIPSGGVTGDLDVEVSIGPLDGEDDDIPRFADNVLFEETVAIVGDCDTYILFSWNSYDMGGQYNTGYAVNNAAAGPDAVNADGEIGNVTLYFFRSDGGENPAPVVIAEDLAPGQTATYALSELGEEFSGYVIAHCEFRYGHGINYLSNFQPDGYAQGFQGLILRQPRPLNQEVNGH